MDESCSKRIESKDEGFSSKKSESNLTIVKHNQPMNKQHIENNNHVLNNKSSLSSNKLKRFNLKQNSAEFNHKTNDIVDDEDDDDNDVNEEEESVSFIFNNNHDDKNETFNSTYHITSNELIHNNNNSKNLNSNQLYDSDNEDNQENTGYLHKKISKSNKRKLNENKPGLKLTGLNDADYRNYLLRTMNEILTSQLTLTRKVDQIRDNFSIINNRIKGN